MGRKCFLHIGMHKTGTSAIQRALEGYDDGQTSYCGFSRRNHSLPIITLFKKNIFKYRIHKKLGHNRQKILQLREMFQKEFNAELNNKSTNTIICGEDLSSSVNGQTTNSIMSFLSEHYSDIEIIAYVRPIQSFAISAFQQRVKGGKANLELPIPNYRKCFKPWIKAAGRDRINFIKYKRSALVNNDVVDDFCDRTGLDVNRVKKIRVNETLSAEAVAILFCHNKFTGRIIGSEQAIVAHNAMVNQIKTIGSNRFGFSTELMSALLDQEAADIEWMEQTAGINLHDPQKDTAITFGSEQDILALADQHVKQVEELFLASLYQSKAIHKNNAALTGALAKLYMAE